MSTARLLIGDVFDRMAELEDGSVDLVLTSPPFLALRSYLAPDHADKGREIGAETSPAAFLETLLALTAEWRRILAPHGSIAVELGDTYAGSGGAGGDYGAGGFRDGQPAFKGSAARGSGWPMPKSLVGIPHLYPFALAYGRNLLTGEPSPAGEWRIRNLVAWCRPNPPVGALGDKFRPATSYITIATIARDRYFDLDAVREHPETPSGHATRGDAGGNIGRHVAHDDVRAEVGLSSGSRGYAGINPTGTPPLDWWEVTTTPYAGAHHAVWPKALLERPIRAMCPQRVCTTCGKPSRRIVEVEPSPLAPADRLHRTGDDAGRMSPKANGKTREGIARRATTVGWSDCGHDAWRRGLVLDPFAGSGTTLEVATGQGRDAIGIDLDVRNADLCVERVGMFLEVDYGTAAAS